MKGYDKKEKSLFRKGFNKTKGKDKIDELEEDVYNSSKVADYSSTTLDEAEKERERLKKEKESGLDFEDGGIPKKKSYFSKLKKACKKK